MLLAKTFTVPVEPVVKPASDVTTSQKPFFHPGTTTSSQTAVNFGPCLDQATGEAVDEMQTATQPLEAPGAGTATQPVQAPGSVPDGQPTGEGDLGAASDSEADQLSVTGSLDDEIHRDRSPDRDVTRDEADQEPTEEANYRETMRGVRSFMNWHKIPEFETVSSAADDNPFAGARVQPTGKVSVKLPVDDWLCRKMSTLNLTITEGYPTRNTDNTGLLRDQFVKPPRSSKWYGMHAEKSSESSTVRTWSPDPAREQTIMCNQAAGLSRCLTRVQDSMATQLKTLRLDSKGKSSEKMKQAVNELEYLTTFNRSISQAMARMMLDLSEGVFLNMANFTLARRDSYLDYLHAGVKQDTVNTLRTSPVHQLISKAEEEISKREESDFKFECRLLCCKCSYCHRVATKERRKSHLLSNVHRNKICEKCFLCRSLEFCKSCQQCPTCCYRSSCRGKVTPVLGEMGCSGFESKSSHHTEGGLQEVYAFSSPGSVLPVQSPTLWSIHSCHGVHSGGQRGQTHGTSEGYKDPPVPR